MSAGAQIEDRFEAGNYAAVTLLGQGASGLSAAQWRMVGLSHLWLRDFGNAEWPLTQASALGDPEAGLELGNLWRLQGLYARAIEQFRAVSPGLTGELALRAGRWWGVAEFQQGEVTAGLRRCEAAWHGYLRLGDDDLSGRVTQTLGQMYAVMGQRDKARRLYVQALATLREEPVPYPRVSTLYTLAGLYIDVGVWHEAEQLLGEARALLSRPETTSPHWLSLVRALEADLYRLMGRDTELYAALTEMQALVIRSGDHEARVWNASRLAEYHLGHGEDARALAALHAAGRPGEPLPAPLRVTRGVLWARRGQVGRALEDFGGALAQVRACSDAHLLTRTLLYLADTRWKAGDHAGGHAALREALEHILGQQDACRYQPDLEELAELRLGAAGDPELAPLMEAVLDHARRAPDLHPAQRRLDVRVSTLGGMEVSAGGRAVKLTLHGSALVLTYLSLYPGQTRAQTQLSLYPDRDPHKASAYVRRAVSELRAALGEDAVVVSGPHNHPVYTLGAHVCVHLDLTELRAALAAGDTPRVLALYRGEFLPAVQDSEWAADLRDELRGAVLLALGRDLDTARAAGDARRELLLLNQMLRVDPGDPLLLDERVRVARRVAAPGDVARYVVEQRRGSADARAATLH